MSTKIDIQPQSDRELAICRLLDIPVEKAFRAWTDPKLFPEWFAPKPWTVSKAELDVRAGGTCFVVMNGPEGQEMPCPGVYLEVIPNKKIVFTDAFTTAWQPSTNPFMVATLTFENENGKTKYTARVRHWTKEACEQHKQMGFLEGWAICADQLEALMKKL
jgi:uncharacterized protein YndB with AHSA1/START domain